MGLMYIFGWMKVRKFIVDINAKVWYDLLVLCIEQYVYDVFEKFKPAVPFFWIRPDILIIIIKWICVWVCPLEYFAIASTLLSFICVRMDWQKIRLCVCVYICDIRLPLKNILRFLIHQDFVFNSMLNSQVFAIPLSTSNLSFFFFVVLFNTSSLIHSFHTLFAFFFFLTFR